MKIALVVGHNSDDKGAYSRFLKTNEFDFNKKAVEKVKKSFHYIDIIERKKVGSYSKEMKTVVDEVNIKGYDLVLELHFNACNGKVRGAEALYWHTSKKGLEYTKLFKKIMEKSGIPWNKFIPVKDSSTRGSYGIMNSKMPYILLEPFYGDNKSDCETIKNSDNMAQILSEYLSEILT